MKIVFSSTLCESVVCENSLFARYYQARIFYWSLRQSTSNFLLELATVHKQIFTGACDSPQANFYWSLRQSTSKFLLELATVHKQNFFWSLRQSTSKSTSTTHFNFIFVSSFDNHFFILFVQVRNLPIRCSACWWESFESILNLFAAWWNAIHITGRDIAIKIVEHTIWLSINPYFSSVWPFAFLIQKQI